MKCKTIIITYSASDHIKKIDRKIKKAKLKLEELKSQKDVIFTQLILIKKALLHAKLQCQRGTDEDVSVMFQNMLSLKCGEGSSPSQEEQLGIKLGEMTLDQNNEEAATQ